MNLIQYLSTIGRLWNSYDGYSVSRFISLSGSHISNRNLHVEDAENLVSRYIKSPLDDVINAHLRVLYYMHESRKFNKLNFN